MAKETDLKQSDAVNLLADTNLQKAIEKADVVEVNGFKILYATPDEIFIIKDNNVIARN